MKLPKFDYARPASIEEAVGLLAARDGAKPLSGGQSLIPVLAFRMGAPSLLVDLGGIPGLATIDIGADGVRLGAAVRWCDIEADGRLHAAHPLLASAIEQVAHYQIRKRGTCGGSLAHADPAAELPGIAVVCDARITLHGPGGVRVVQADDFFLGPLTTAIAPDELITAIHLPPWPAARRWGFEEFARQQGAFALAGAMAFYDAGAGGEAIDAHVGAIGVNSRPRRLAAAEAALNGRPATPETIAEAAAAAAAECDPPDDLHGSAAYRRALLGALVERALQAAASRGAANRGAANRGAAA